MRLSAAVSLFLFTTTLIPAADWPAWRGPRGDGHCSEKDLPLTWSATENVRWKIPLPEGGNSTPIIVKDRIFLTQAITKDKSRNLLCLDRAGKQRWKAEVIYKEAEATHGTNPYCSASPVSDGERVIVSHGSAGLFCYDFEGKELWKRDFGKQDHIWGNASSPVIHNDLVYLWVGPGESQVLVALNKKDGAVVWEHKEPGGKTGTGGNAEWVGSWSTPIIARVDNREELILSMPHTLRAFDPTSGKQLWHCGGLTRLVYTSPVCSKDGVVVALSGFHGHGLAVNAGGEGDVTKTRRLWHHDKAIPQRIGSPVIIGDHAYLINEQGLAQCFNLKTGNDLWNKERLENSTWSSPIVAGGRIYILCQNAETIVLNADPELKILARNKLPSETARASIAVSNGDLFIRTYKHLWCIGK